MGTVTPVTAPQSLFSRIHELHSGCRLSPPTSDLPLRAIQEFLQHEAVGS